MDKKERVKIIEPSKEIFQIIDYYKKIVKKALPKSKVTLIGSFAVPMCGKEEFDLLVETDDIKKAQHVIKEKGKGRFGIGPVVRDMGFCRSKKRFGIICELHIVPKEYKKSKNHFKIIKKLKSNPELLKKYEDFKRSLDGYTLDRYKKEKNKFLMENNLN